MGTGLCQPVSGEAEKRGTAVRADEPIKKNPAAFRNLECRSVIRGHAAPAFLPNLQTALPEIALQTEAKIPTILTTRISPTQKFGTAQKFMLSQTI
jgi:hypothetical protein